MVENDSTNSDPRNFSRKWQPSTVEELINMLFHELRTPITVIKGYATLLVDERHQDLHPEAIENILYTASALESLLNDAMDHHQSLMKKHDA